MLNFIARNFGLNVVASQVMPLTSSGAPILVLRTGQMSVIYGGRLVVNNDQLRLLPARSREHINRDCVIEKINAIGHPTLIIAGEEDITTPPDEGSREIHSRVEGSQLVVIPACR